MRLRAIVLATVIAALAPSTAFAIETYSSSQLHQVIAKAVVPDRNNEQLYLTVVAGTSSTPEVERYATSDGVYYQFTGTVELGLDGKTKVLQPGDGMFIEGGSKFTLKSLDANHFSYLQFLLSPTPGTQFPAAAEGTSVELYRSPTPVPGLTHERNLLTLIRVPVPPQSLPDPLHRRTGAALHYILSGVGAESADGQTMAHGPGSVTFEPAGYTYQWSNPGIKPLTYLLFNVSPKDIEPVIVQDQQPEDPPSHNLHVALVAFCVAFLIAMTLVVTSSAVSDDRRE